VVAAAPPSTPQPPVFKAGPTRRVDVTVLDASKPVINGLRSGHFDVREDGIPVIIDCKLIVPTGEAPADDNSLPIRRLARHVSARATTSALAISGRCIGQMAAIRARKPAELRSSPVHRPVALMDHCAI
jgi:hypothetical protein